MRTVLDWVEAAKQLEECQNAVCGEGFRRLLEIFVHRVPPFPMLSPFMMALILAPTVS